MKYLRLLQHIVLAVFTVALLAFISCGGDGTDDPDPEPEDPMAIALQKLTGATWAMTSVTRDGLDVSSEFDGFTISFTSTGFTTTNGTGAWAPSGTWTWADAQASSMTLGDGVLVQIAFSSNDTVLTVSLTVSQTTFSIGKSASVAGDYVFVLSKQ